MPYIADEPISPSPTPFQVGQIVRMIGDYPEVPRGRLGTVTTANTVPFVPAQFQPGQPNGSVVLTALEHGYVFVDFGHQRNRVTAIPPHDLEPGPAPKFRKGDRVRVANDGDRLIPFHMLTCDRHVYVGMTGTVAMDPKPNFDLDRLHFVKGPHRAIKVFSEAGFVIVQFDRKRGTAGLPPDCLEPLTDGDRTEPEQEPELSADDAEAIEIFEQIDGELPEVEARIDRLLAGTSPEPVQRLPNGAHVEFGDIKRIIPSLAGGTPHVGIVFRDNTMYPIPCDSADTAQTIADDIAAMVNAGRRPPT
jgi:hypothetical protein